MFFFLCIQNNIFVVRYYCFNQYFVFLFIILLQNDAFYGTGTIALNDKLSLPMQDINNDYDNQLKNDLEFKKLEVNINVK